MRVFRLFHIVAAITLLGTTGFSAAALANSPELPDKAPIPTLNRQDPVESGETINPAGADKAPQTEKKKPKPDPRSATMPQDKMPAEEIACRVRLKALGVAFEEHVAERDATAGCSVPYPVMVTKLGASLDLAPPAELNCTMAEAAARFIKDVVTPAAKATFGKDIEAIAQASAFVCRPRHNGSKISEHAFGNALDIAGFTLEDGMHIEVGPKPPKKQAKFLDTVRAAACGPFKTVLGPGSDPDHERHFHFDLEPRRRNDTFCQ